jgi:hypothetical protein
MARNKHGFLYAGFETERLISVWGTAEFCLQYLIHKEYPTRCHSVSEFLFHIYMKFNMFRVKHRPSSGA